MKHLSGLDSTFLYLETPETPMHVGGLNLFELPEGYVGDFYEDVKSHVEKRMPKSTLTASNVRLNVLVTSGGTVEPIDGVRALTNTSGRARVRGRRRGGGYPLR